MATLLLRFSAPLQAWGTQSRFTDRDTGREPSKSGVVGLLCAALGLRREHALEPLRGLRMGVRVDKEGIVLKDYQTTYPFVNWEGKPNKTKQDAIVSNRYYLSDAYFLVGLESDNINYLRELANAVLNPQRPLYLGRKAFPPGEPLLPSKDYLGFDNPTPKKLEDALRKAPYPLHSGENEPPTELRLIIELFPNHPDYLTRTVIRMDQPRSFSERTFEQRRVVIDFCSPIAERS